MAVVMADMGTAIDIYDKYDMYDINSDYINSDYIYDP